MFDRSRGARLGAKIAPLPWKASLYVTKLCFDDFHADIYIS